MLNFKKLQNECFYFGKNAKNYFLQNVTLNKDLKIDFDANYNFYKLQNKSLIVNNVVKYTFKTKKEYLKICYQVNLLNTLDDLKNYTNITIFKHFKNYTNCGIGKYNIQVFGNYEKQQRILNITCLIATIRACLNMDAIMQNDCLIGYDMDDIYIQRMLEKYNIKCFR